MRALGANDPTRVGSYRMLGRLGEGGMGSVYLGRSPGGRTVALKLVQRELAQLPEFRARFAREVAAARKVGGEWTAAVLDADTEAEVPWVATRYVPGPSLHEVVADNYGPLPESSVRVLAHRLAQALEAVHTAGLIHRDLKPGNVLVTVDGPRVIDFGIARALDILADTADGLRTRTGVVIGSPGFMSPEQVHGRELTFASDVFSLGSVLAFAATGRLPFAGGGSGVHAQLFRVAEEEPDLAGLPESLDDLVRTCLAKDPAARPTPTELAARTAGKPAGPWLPGEVLEQLSRRATELLDVDLPDEPAPDPSRNPEPYGVAPVSPYPPPPQSPPPAPPGAYGPPPGSYPAPTARRRRRVVLAAGLATVLVAAGTGLVVALSPWDRDDKPVQGLRDLPNAFDNGWEGRRTSTDESATGVVPVRLEFREGDNGSQYAEFSVLHHNRLCVTRSLVESASVDEEESGRQRLKLGAAEVRTTTPRGNEDACWKPPSAYLATTPTPGKINWSDDKHKLDLTRQTPRHETPVSASFAGSWRIDRPGRPDGPSTLDALHSVNIPRGAVAQSSLTLVFQRGDQGRPCTYRTSVFDVLPGQLVTDIAELKTGESDASCPKTRDAQLYRLVGGKLRVNGLARTQLTDTADLVRDTSTTR